MTCMRSLTVLAFVLSLVFLPGLAPAQDGPPETFAVLPFEVHGPQKYSYLEQGIQSMLVSRLTWQDRYHPLDRSRIRAASGEIDSAARAESVRTDLEADYLIWGSVTIMDQETSLDVRVLDAEGRETPYTRQTSMEQLIPSLETVAGSINTQVFQRIEPEPAAQEEGQGARPLNPDLVYNESDAGSFYLNPEFSYAGATDENVRWRSQSLPMVGIGMVVDDIDSDGQNEVLILEEHGVFAYRLEEGRLRPIGDYQVSSRIQCLNINLIDLNRDGLQEIVVSALYGEETPSSFILNFKDGSFSLVHDDIRLLLNVVRTPPDYLPVLVGQKVRMPRIFFGQVAEVIRQGDEYQLERTLNLPSKANVFNFAYLPFEQEYKILVVSEKNKLLVYSATGHLQAGTEEMYAGSSLGIAKPDILPGMGERRPEQQDDDYYYLPSRLIPVNLDKDNHFELLVNKNISVSAQFFSRYRYFPQGEIHNLFWDGVGLNINWKTRRIKGSVVDYGIADIDNNGKLELYVCLNTHPGITGLNRRQTIVLAYSLDLDEGEVNGIIRPAQE
ncbi:MAG: FG-GAP-like repeat-containing protein [Desulfohalobiaceae bacterium]